MVKFMTVLAFSFLLMNDMALAAIYKCTDAQGVVIYSDDPTNMPRGCNTDQAVTFPQLNVVPAQAAPPEMQNEASSPATAPAASTQPEGAGDAYAALNDEADALVKRYVAARQKATFSPVLKNKEAAKNELKELRLQRTRLVSEVEKSPLLQVQKNEILGKLSAMAE